APGPRDHAMTITVERLTIPALSAFTGLHTTTILIILETAGANCRKLWDAKIRGIRTQFVQADEIWSFVGCHQRRLPMNAPAEWGDQYVWIALDSVTKMVLGFHVGKREAVSANEFMRDLSERIDGRFQLTTDGLRWYVPAVEEHFAGRADYAMLIKLFSSHDITGPEWYGATSRVT